MTRAVTLPMSPLLDHVILDIRGPQGAELNTEDGASEKDVGKGTGLGLAIVHDIIEAHGGNVTLINRPGLGTSFII